MQMVFPSMNSISAALIAISIASTGVDFCNAQTSKLNPSAAPAEKTSVRERYGKLPLSFEANRGQADKGVNFLARGRGYGLFLSGQEAVLALRGSKPAAAEEIVRMELRGASSTSQPAGLDALPGTVNYFLGSDASNWQTGIPTYSRVRFAAVYPGVDVVYYGNQGQLEYDFVVAVHADPNVIRLNFTGASKLNLNAHGDLSIEAKTAKIAFNKPTVYQEMNGMREAVQGQFVLLDSRTVGFKLGSFNHDQPLVIDPVLVYSSYIGGTTNDAATAVAADAAGNTYVAGNSGSFNFPRTWKAYQTAPGPGFITKLNPTGTKALYSTYFDAGVSAIAADADGNAYITGSAGSGFAVTPGAYQTTYAGNGDAYITKLNPTGTALVYSTYLGGSGSDGASAIALDSSGNAYIAGQTSSANFPASSGAYQSTYRDLFGNGNAFAAAINSTGTALLYATYLGGSGNCCTSEEILFGAGEALQGLIFYGDGAQGVAVDSSGNAYVAGYTNSADFPVTQGAYLATPKPGFITKLNPTGGAVYSTYFDGGVSGIAVDGSGNAYVTGGALGGDPPVTPGAFDSGNGVPFVSKLNHAGSALVYSANLGGGHGGAGFGYGYGGMGIGVDSAGNAYVGGNAGDGLVVTPGINNPTPFITKLNSTGSTVLYSTFLSGSGSDGNGDFANGFSADQSGNAYIVGAAASHDFPVTPLAFRTFNPISVGFSPYMCCTGGYTGFVSKLALASPALTNRSSIVLTSTASEAAGSDNYDFVQVQQTYGTPVTFTATVSGSGTAPTGDVYFTLNGGPVATVPLNGGTASYTNSTLNFGATTVQAIYGGDANYAVSNTALVDDVSAGTPSIVPAGGKFVGSVQVNINSSSADTNIYYTLDGSFPSMSSTLYTGPFTIANEGATVQVRAVAGPNNGQGVNDGTFTYAFFDILPQTPTPMISPTPGGYPVGQLITITDAIPTATIRYTTDGTTPTTKSTFYSKPFPLTGTETIKAIAISTDDAESNVAVAAFSN
jgi:Chitobiase/beta-hexosaminidase C-terminal domain/Bacterial Ig-like domain (group 3)/Beta-propeller repeat